MINSKFLVKYSKPHAHNTDDLINLLSEFRSCIEYKWDGFVQHDMPNREYSTYSEIESP